MNALGKHVIAEFYECDYETINNHELVEDIMLKSVDLSGATTI
ncbi:S-adenosylmethionine decarboxylase, partial [Leptospira interrogans]